MLNHKKLLEVEVEPTPFLLKLQRLSTRLSVFLCVISALNDIN